MESRIFEEASPLEMAIAQKSLGRPMTPALYACLQALEQIPNDRALKITGAGVTRSFHASLVHAVRQWYPQLTVTKVYGEPAVLVLPLMEVSL